MSFFRALKHSVVCHITYITVVNTLLPIVKLLLIVYIIRSRAASFQF